MAEEEATTPVEVKPVKFGDREWHDYVMSKFAEDEIFQGNPKVDGLWRVTEEVLGIITDYTSNMVESPSEKNGFCATAECSITVAPYTGNIKWLNSSGVGDCSQRNSDKVYGKYPSSLAETRAKARALRTLLRLRNVVAAEELIEDSIDETDEYITDNQIDRIDILCKKLDLNVVKLLTDICRENDFELKTLSKVRKHIAAKMIKRVNNFQDDKNLIKPDQIGYKEAWRK